MTERHTDRLTLELDITGRRVFVIGETGAADEAVRQSLAAGGSVTCLSEHPLPAWTDLAAAGADITVLKEPYRREQILDASMVFACSEDPVVNNDVYAACRCLGIPVYTEGQPRKCDFYLRTGTIERSSDAGDHPEETDPEETDPEHTDLRLLMSLQKLGVFDIIIFSDAESVQMVFRQMAASEIDVRGFAGCRIAAAGKETVDLLKDHGLYPDFSMPPLPDMSVKKEAEGVNRYFRDHVVRGTHFPARRAEDVRMLIFSTGKRGDQLAQVLRDYPTETVYVGRRDR